VGTIVYMAPESLALGIVTEKSDVWAIGIMLYQLTHGHLPWKNSGNDKKLLKL
jgi:serine/threonine protein kinase